MSKRIVVPVDDSDRSVDALEFAVDEFPDAEITALHVLDPGDFYAATGVDGGAMANYEQIYERHEQQADRILENAVDLAADRGVEIDTDRVIGGISRSIVDYVEEHDADQIVVGSHGRTGASRILLGSVAETVARRSPVPVTIVR